MTELQKIHSSQRHVDTGDIVLDKSIFNTIFEKDIRRVFIYKKAERLAKAIHIITPAFAEAVSLMDRITAVSVRLIDAALLPPVIARQALSKELLALTSILSIARVNSLLSAMNADLIIREAHMLLQELAIYEEPRLALPDSPTLAALSKQATAHAVRERADTKEEQRPKPAAKHVIKDMNVSDTHVKDRRNAILSVIRTKHRASIKDISTVIRGVSEKTIQRELIALISSGEVTRQGERRWSTYSLA